MLHMSDVSEHMRDLDPALRRYSRQVLFEPIGEQGQRRLRTSNVAIVGCGALGSVLANTLVRAGVGFVRLIDRDFIEINNLQRQVLFDEQDIADNLPKAEAAARKLRRINSAVEVEAIVTDVNATNVERLCADADLILDGTDNFETRFLINDLAVKHEQPWVYGACIAAEGLLMTVLPGQTPCLRCIWEDAPPPGMSPTCDTAGVLASVVNVVASLQALEAMKLLTGKRDALTRGLITIDAWSGTFRTLDMQSALERGNCPCCKQQRYEFLAGERITGSTTLCGRDAVQVLPQAAATEGGRSPGLNFKQLAARLSRVAVGRPRYNEHMLKFHVDAYELTVFPDGRAIIQGTSDAGAARGIYNKYVGG
jgi:molybdopterin/thiamine biosynthesis adenylyltransferase